MTVAAVEESRSGKRRTRVVKKGMSGDSGEEKPKKRRRS